MAEIELYSYSGCSSCRNVEAILAQRGAEVAKRDIFKDRLSGAEIAALFARIGVSAREMLSTRSRPYRDLGLAEGSLTDGEIVELMSEYPALLRRPIVVSGSRSQVGFNRAAIERFVATANGGGDGDA